jgi:1,4-alpha-glucan branching enzyme
VIRAVGAEAKEFIMVTVHGNYVQFRFFRPGAQSVHLAGDFNGWQDHALQMIPTANGYWVAVLRLEPGSYRFRYLADGRWYADYAAFGIEYGPYGPDSVIRVGPPKPQREPSSGAKGRKKSSHGPAVLSFAAALASAQEPSAGWAA